MADINQPYKSPTEMQRECIKNNIQKSVDDILADNVQLAILRGADKISLSLMDNSINHFGRMGLDVEAYRDIYAELKTGSTIIYSLGKNRRYQ